MLGDAFRVQDRCEKGNLSMSNEKKKIVEKSGKNRDSVNNTCTAFRVHVRVI
jgi:hypothetical protein